MDYPNPIAPPPVAHSLLADAAAIVDELFPLFDRRASARVDLLLHRADQLAEQEAWF